jgi:DNA-binding CsgD family transcriptional regulator
VLLSGEAGVGKSRLIAELREIVRRDGIETILGQSFEQDSSLPYAPILDLLRGLVVSAPPRILTSLAAHAEELVKLVPEVTAVLPDVKPSQPLDPEPEKRRLQHAITQFLLGLAGDGLLLVFEDCHWADDVSLEVLTQLSRAAASAPLLLLITFRPEDMRPELRRLRASLARSRLAIEMALAPLDPSDVTAMVEAIRGSRRPTPPLTSSRIYSLTDGNPFYVEEIVSLLETTPGSQTTPEGAAGSGWPVLAIPEAVADAIGLRVATLSHNARRTVSVAAVQGQRFDFAVLQSVTGLGDQDLVDRIKELVDAHLVVEISDEQFAFRHALTRGVIYSKLLARERKVLHREVADSIERASGATQRHLSELSYHLLEAGEWERALTYALRAGDQADALRSPSAAVEHLTRALVAAARLGASRTPMLRARGRAYERLGAFEPARTDQEAALASAQAEADNGAEWQALLDLGMLWAGRDYEQSGHWLRLATEKSRDLPEPSCRAHSLNRFGNWLVNTGSPGDGADAHREALAIFRTRGDRGGIAETQDLMGMAHWFAGESVAAVGDFDNAVDLFRAENDQLGLASALTSRGLCAGMATVETIVSSGRSFSECLKDTNEALRLAQESEWFAGQVYALFAAGSIRAGFGDLGAAIEQGAAALRLAEQIEHPQWIAGARCYLGQAYVLLMAPEPAIELLTPGLEMARSVRSTWWSGSITTHLALAHLLRNDARQAERVLHDEMPPEAPAANLVQRRLTWAWGRLRLSVGDAASALTIANRLLESLPAAARAIPALRLLQGEALLAAGQPEAAIASLIDARDAAGQRGELPRLWSIHSVLARAHQRLKDRDAARRELDAARLLIDQLSASVEDQGLRGGFIRAALDSLPAVRTTRAHAAAADFEGLTPRERAVAAQVALGRTNREIAQILFIVEKTVEAHVSSCLGKLGLRSRTQLAAWATTRGLTPAQTLELS